ncbi:MAG TPA: MATE family efflux transporter [Polyangiaceae bacterium]|nr:MATE family efflux transporter [Polyangiaceae bacterium]
MTERILRGPLAWEVFRFGAPLALGMGLQTTFNLVDAYILGRLPEGVAGAALGAIGIADQLTAIGTILSYGFSVAAAAMISRRKGEGDAEGVRRLAFQSLLLVLALSAAVLVFALLGSGLLMKDVVGAKGQVALLGTNYLRVMVAGSGSIFLLLHLTSIQRALGSSKTPIALLLGANVLNFFLAVLLVYGPGEAPPVFAWGPPVARALHLPRLELLGAAWATLLARAAVLPPALFILVGRHRVLARRDFSGPDRGVISSIVGVGWPTSMQLVVRTAAMLVTHSIVARAFTTEADQSATTALGIVFRLETMALFIGLGWGSAAQTFVGQCLGANEKARAQASGVLATAYDAAMMALIAALYAHAGATIVAFFDPSPSVVGFAMDYVRVVSPSYVGLGVGIVLGSAMQGAGATRSTLVIDAIVVCVLQIPASVLVTFGFGGGAHRLFQVVAATYAAYALVYALVYRRGTFLSTELPA